MKNEKFKLICYWSYTILWETAVWSSALYIVYVLGFSAWLLLLAVIMSSSQLKPRHFGINEGIKRHENMNKDEFDQYKEAMKLEIELEKLKGKS